MCSVRETQRSPSWIPRRWDPGKTGEMRRELGVPQRPRREKFQEREKYGRKDQKDLAISVTLAGGVRGLRKWCQCDSGSRLEVKVRTQKTEPRIGAGAGLPPTSE